MNPCSIFSSLLNRDLNRILIRHIRRTINIRPQFIQTSRRNRVLNRLAAFGNISSSLLRHLNRIASFKHTIRVNTILRTTNPHRSKNSQINKNLLTLLPTTMIANRNTIHHFNLSNLTIQNRRRKNRRTRQARTLNRKIKLRVTVMILTNPSMATIPLRKTNRRIISRTILMDRTNLNMLILMFNLRRLNGSILRLTIMNLRGHILNKRMRQMVARRTMIRTNTDRATSQVISIMLRLNRTTIFTMIMSRILGQLKTVIQDRNSNRLTNSQGLRVNNLMLITRYIANRSSQLNPTKRRAERITRRGQLTRSHTTRSITGNTIKKLPRLLRARFLSSNLVKDSNNTLSTSVILLSNINNISNRLIVNLITILSTRVMMIRIRIRMQRSRTVLSIFPSRTYRFITIRFSSDTFSLSFNRTSS